MSENLDFPFLAGELAEKAKKLGKLGATLKFVFDGHGAVHIDATGDEAKVTTQDLPADLTISASLDTWLALRAKKISAPVAAMTRKIRLEGNAMLFTKLGPKVSSVL